MYIEAGCDIRCKDRRAERRSTMSGLSLSITVMKKIVVISISDEPPSYEKTAKRECSAHSL